jgi:hypothetical protein
MATVTVKRGVLEIDIRIARADGSEIEIDVCDHSADEIGESVKERVGQIVRAALALGLVSEVDLFVGDGLEVAAAEESVHGAH